MRIWALRILRAYFCGVVTIPLLVLSACGGRGLVPLPSGTQTQNAESGYGAGTSKGPQPGSETGVGSSSSPGANAGGTGGANAGGSSGSSSGTGGEAGQGSYGPGDGSGASASSGGSNDAGGGSGNQSSGGSSSGQTSTAPKTPPPRSAPAPPPPHYVLLEWQRSPSAVMGYNIYRGTHKGGPYQKLNKDIEPATSYTDHAVVAGGRYFYVITSVDASKEGPYSNEAAAAVPTP